MWIGMYLIFVLIALGFAWVAITQFLIPVMTDRPLLPIFTVGRAQHGVAAAREEKLIVRLHGETQLLKSKSDFLEAEIRKEVRHLTNVIEGSDAIMWRETCQATLSRLRLAIEEIDAH